MRKILSCEFNLDTACVELVMEDGMLLSIDCTAVENEAANNMYQRSELDWLIYNDPLAYAELILNGEPDRYLKVSMLEKDSSREPLSILLFTSGLGIFLSNMATVIFSSNILATQTAYTSQTVKLGEIIVSVPRMISFLIALVCTIILYLVIQRSEFGRALRATAQNRHVASLMGINHKTIYALAMGIGLALVGISGSLLVPNSAVSPTIGSAYGTKCFIIVVLGGKGSVPGALLGGLIVGLIEKFGGIIWTDAYASLLVFVLLNYGHSEALRGVSLEVNEGEIVALLGNNGAGKTTTINTVSGMTNMIKGSIEFMGVDISKMPAYERVKQGIIQIPEGRKLFPFLSVMDNLLVGSYLPEARKHRKEQLELCFHMFPKLYERRNQLAHSLSGGEQQMCAIARGLMQCPKILMLDEPSLGLAPIIVDGIFDSLVEINRNGMTILLVEQNVMSSLNIADRAYVIEIGQNVMDGTSAQLLADEQLRSAYLGI